MSDEPIEGVLFDLDGTLCEYRRTTADMLELVHDVVGVDQFVSEAEYVEKYGQFAEDSDDMVDLRERCFVAIAEEKGRDPAVARKLARVYAERRDHSRVSPEPGAPTVLEALAGRVPVGLVTNGAPEMQREKLSALGIAEHFDLTVFAGYDGVEAKPSSEPFDHGTTELGVEAARTLYVGNSPGADVAGAHAAGIGSVLYSTGPDPDPSPDYRVESLDELYSLAPWPVERPA